MRRQRILGILATHADELHERFSVSYLALFGSVARDASTDASDVDVLVEFGRTVGSCHSVERHGYLEEILAVPHADLVQRDAVHPALREIIYGEAIRAA